MSPKIAKIRPYISLNNSKLGLLIPCVNLPYGTTCREDAPCYKDCYAHKGNMARQNFKTCAEENLKTYKENPKLYFQVISTHLELVPYKFFRWHSSGDIPDEQYFDLMCKLARKHLNTQFLCFTKKHEIVNTYLNNHRKPKNLILVLSNWGDWICPNPHNLPTAYIELKNQVCMIPSNATKCTGFCGECCTTQESCWKMKNGDSVVFKQH